MNDLAAFARSDGGDGWDDFVRPIAAAARVRVEDIAPSTRLDDLGIDSLALTEVAVALIVDFGMETIADDLDRRDWTGVTVGALYEEFKMGRQAHRE